MSTFSGDVPQNNVSRDVWQPILRLSSCQLLVARELKHLVTPDWLPDQMQTRSPGPTISVVYTPSSDSNCCHSGAEDAESQGMNAMPSKSKGSSTPSNMIVTFSYSLDQRRHLRYTAPQSYFPR